MGDGWIRTRFQLGKRRSLPPRNQFVSMRESGPREQKQTRQTIILYRTASIHRQQVITQCTSFSDPLSSLLQKLFPPISIPHPPSHLQTRRLHCTSLASRRNSNCLLAPAPCLRLGTGRISFLRLRSVCAVLLRKGKPTNLVSPSIDCERSISGSLVPALTHCVLCTTPSPARTFASLRRFTAEKKTRPALPALRTAPPLFASNSHRPQRQ